MMTPFEEAKQIAAVLGETQPFVIRQIVHLTRELGAEFLQEAVHDATAIEESGGMLVQDGSRRRTPGGVFFQLVRERVSADKRAILFRPRKSRGRSSSTGVDT